MINLAQTFFRSFLAESDLDPDSLHGVVEDFDWPTHREAKQWLDHHLRGLDIWRRHRQSNITANALGVVAQVEHTHATSPASVGRTNIVARDLARQLENSVALTRLFSDLRAVESDYEDFRNLALEQYEALVAHLDSLEVR